MCCENEQSYALPPVSKCRPPYRWLSVPNLVPSLFPSALSPLIPYLHSVPALRRCRIFREGNPARSITLPRLQG